MEKPLSLLCRGLGLTNPICNEPLSATATLPMNEKTLIVDDAPESRRNLGSLRSGGLVGGRRPLMLSMLALAALGGSMGSVVYDGFKPARSNDPEKPREKTPDDIARIEAARLKRERKASKKSARTTTPNA